jgi:hypothetical protein
MIRGIRNAQALFSDGREDELNEVLAAITQLVLRAPTNAAVVVAAVEELHPMHLDDYPDLPPEKLTRFLGADETIAVFALSFLVRRLSKVCPPEPWGELLVSMKQQVAIGRELGAFIPQLGTGQSMMVTGVPFLALGAMLATLPTEFLRFQSAFRSFNDPFDIRAERELFGANHLEVAATLSRTLGLGTVLSMSFLDQHDSPARLLRCASEALAAHADPAHESCLPLLQTLSITPSDNLKDNIEEILSSPNVSSWLYATAADEEG